MLQVKVKVNNVEILCKHLIGREQSRHPFAVILLVTTLWRLPCCFAAMLFCADTITRRLCRARSKVKGHRPFVLIQLPVRVRFINPNSVVCSEPYYEHCRVSNPNERSKIIDLLYLFNCQLGLVTLILSSVVNPNTNPVGLVTLMKGQRSPTFCTDTIAS